MKRFWSLVLALTMVAQMMLGGVALSDAAPVNGDGSIYIYNPGDYVHDGDVNSTGWYAIDLSNSGSNQPMTLLVKGDVTGQDGGIYTSGPVSAEVQGDLNAGQNAINVHGDAVITVEGNVASTNNNGVNVYNESTWNPETQETEYTDANAVIDISGSVDAHGSGISVTGNTVVTVGGDIDAGHVYQYSDIYSDGSRYEDEHGTGTGVNAAGSSDVVVGGNVSSYGTGVSTQDNAKVTVNGSIDAGYEGYYKQYNVDGSLDYKGTNVGGYGVGASDSSTVEVTGSVESVGTAVYVTGDAKVAVDDDVTSTKSSGVVVRIPQREGHLHGQIRPP